MKRKHFFGTVCAMVLLGTALLGCTGGNSLTLANPAAEFCVESGGQHEIRTLSDGSQSGVCILPDGSKVDAWQYFHDNAQE